jgi:UDP-N-acetylmuramate dehydrogenase
VKAAIRTQLRECLHGDVSFDVRLERLSTYRIGGPASVVVVPACIEDVIAVTRLARDANVPCMALGLGSNVLFDDLGYGGIVLRMGKAMAEVTRSGPEGSRWTVGAGLPTPLFARRSARAGMAGVHRLVGVPGAVGGGVFMNAGAHGQEYGNVVRSVLLVTPLGEPSDIPGDRIPWRYRASGLEGVIVSATMELIPADKRALEREIRQYLAHRRQKTPFDQPCCGSVFRNPSPEECRELTGMTGPFTAGRLVEAVGLKGFRVGGAEVSPLHANYIVNTGGATAADVRAVIDHIRQCVFDRFGVRLIREVQYVTTGDGENGHG